MSTMIGTPRAKVMIVERQADDMSAFAYEGRLEAVIALIDNGSLGGGFGYGCDEHKAALDQIEKQIADTRASIEQLEAEE